MRVFSFVLIVFGATSAMGTSTKPQIVTGRFAYRGGYELKSHRHFEILNGASPVDQARLDELRAEGYACFEKLDEQFYCGKDFAVDPQDPAIAARVNDRFGVLQVRLNDASDVRQTIDSDDYDQWEVQQKAAITSKSMPLFFDTVTYARSAGEPGKIFPGGADNPHHDMFTPIEGGLAYEWDLSEQVDAGTLDNYTIMMTLARVQE